MRPKFIVLAPYNLHILNAIIDACLLKLASFTIVGDKSKIIMLCLKHNINYSLFDIYHEVGDVNICLRAEQIIKSNKIQYIINGSIASDVMKNFFSYLGEKALTNLIITVFESFNQYIFFCYPDLSNCDFEDCITNINSAKTFLASLGIKNYSTAIYDDQSSPSKKIEVELIRQYLTEKLKVDCIIYDFLQFKKMFENVNSSLNIKTQLILLKDIYNYQILFSFLNNNHKIKISHLTIYKNHTLIMGDNTVSSDEILFSVFLVNKLFKAKSEKEVIG